MNEQILKDLVATAQKHNYNWEKISSLFPEFKGYDIQLLKDYVATAEKYNYDYKTVNSKFPEFGFKKKEPTVLPSEQAQKPSSSDTAKKKATQPSVSSGGDDGIYEYSGRKGAIYKKQGGKWFVDPNGVGAFQEIKDPSGDRANVLNKQAKRIYNSPFEQENVDWQPVPSGKPKERNLSEEDQIQQQVFSDKFAAVDRNDPKVLAQNKIDEAISSIDGKLIGRFNEDEFKRHFDVILNSNDYTKGLFEIEQTGAGYNAVRVKNKYTGEYRDISLKNWSEGRDKDETELFKAFIDVNAKFADLGKMQAELSQLESNRSKLTGMDKIDADRRITELRDKIKLETKLRNNYALSDRYRAAAVFNESIVGKINDDMTKLQLEAIDLSEEQKELSNWSSEVESAVKDGRISMEQYEAQYLPKLQAQQQMVSKKAVGIQGKAKDITTSFGDLDILAGLNYAVQEQRGNILTGTAASFAEGAESVVRFAFENTSGLDSIEKGEIASQFTPGIITKEYLTSEERSMFEKAIFGVANSFGAIAAGMVVPGYGQTAGLFASSYMSMKDQMNTPEFSDVPEYEKILLSSTYGVVISQLEKFGIDRMLSKTPIGKSAVNWILGTTMKSLPKNATAEVFEAAINENIKAAIAKGIINTAGAALAEGGTEAIQEAADITIKSVYNAAKGTDLFDSPKTIGEALGQIGEAGVLGMIGGGTIASVSQAVRTPRDMRTAAQFNEMAKAIEDKNLSDIVRTSIKGKVLTGEMSKGEADAIIKEMDESKAVLDKIPAEIKPEQKFSAFNLINERDQLEQDIQGKDENLTVVQRERIKEINNELQQISRDAVQEQTTGQVPVQPEATVSEEVEEGKPEAESQVVTEEGKEEVVIDKPTIASNATAELDRVKSVAAEAEDGATFNLDGTKYEGGGLIVPVASKNTTIEEITPEMIAEFVEENSSKIGDKNTVKFGIYKFPNSNEVSIDLNVVAPESSRDVAIEFGKRADQESLFDLSTFENVKTGGTGMNPKSFTDEQFKEIAKALNEGRVPNVFDVDVEMQPTEVTVENAEQFKRTALAESGNQDAPKVVQAAKNVIKALPGLKVHVHTNQESYLNGIAKSAGIKVEEITDEQGDQRSNGRYVNGEIHIDLSAPNADEVTIYHEAFHHALLQSGKTSENMVEMVNGLKKALGSKHKDLVEAVDNFAASYSEDGEFTDADRAEEFLAELGGLLAQETQTLDTTTLQRIATIINRMAKKLIGRPIFKEAASRQEIVDFMNSLSRGMARGEQVLTEGISTVIKPVSKKRRSETKVRDNYKLSFVKSEDIIDIESLIDDIASKNQKVWFWVADQLGRGMYDDAVIGESHYLDAGPSFALDPENRANGVIWASGLDKKKLEKNVSDSDYIFIISGSPKASKLFNKQVYSLFTKRAGDFNSFKKGVLKNSKLSGLNKFFNQFSSWEDIEIGYFKETDKKPQEPARKWLLKTMESIGQKNTDLKKFIVSRGGIIDIDSLRDDFYRENGFDMNDIMIVLRPTAVGGKSKHSTYETDILGEVVGVPDKIVNASDIMPEDVYQSVKNLQRSQASQKIAPYGSGIRPIVSRNKRMSAPVAGNKLFNEPLKDATTIAKSYMNKKGLDYIEVEKISKLNEDLSKKIADAYDAMKNDPTNPEVKAAYEAMADETLDQYNDIVSNGYVVEINNSEPYSSSEDMIKDLRDNKRMKIFSTESGFGYDPITDQQREENILLRDSGMKDVNGQTLLINDVFRFVHDFFGHAKLGNGFGPIGEENAWRVHAVMYTDLARRAMTSETRGQNSWVNFSGVNAEAFKKRDKARELRKEGKTAEADSLVGQVYEEMQFAEQKMGLMPEWTATEGAPVGKKRMAGSNTKQQAIQDAKDKYDLSVKQRGNSHKQGVSAALGDLQKSDWYKQADDTQREEAVREIKSFFGERLKKAPSTAKITGKPKDKKVTVNESTALKDQIRLEARAAREAKGDMKAKQTKLIDSINSLKDQGILNVNQVSAMLNRIKRLNLDNPVAVAEFLDYAQRVFERADYQATLAEANNISRRIKKLVKSDKLQASTAAIAKAFSKIDPKYVDDIDAYMEMAQTVFDAVKSAKVTADGIDTKTAMDYEMVNEYVESTMKEQEQRKADMMLEIYADMFDGVDTQDMKLEDIIEFVNAMKENPEGVSTEEKVRQTRTFVQKMVEVYKPIVRQILNGTDPFTGEDVVIDQKSADIMTELLDMDLSEMDVRDAIAVVEAMDNFVVNQAVDGLEAVVATQRGIKNAKALRDSGVKARAMSTIGREGGTIGFGKYWVGSIMSLKTASDLIFKGVNSAIKVLKDIGVTAFENGVSAAKKMWTNYINDYEAAFAKKKPNGKNFMDAENIYERGMYAFIKRTVTGDVDAQAKELNRKIKLIKDSVEVLRKHGGNKHKQAADMYEALIDKLGLNEDGVTVADIEQRVDGINKDAVNWWVDTWAKHYSDLYDVSLNVYNTKIDKDMFYTPDKYSTLKKEKAEVENAMSQGGGFAMVNGFEYDKKSGVLMPSSKPASMESQRYVDLNFDMNNSKSLKAALVDIKTAASIRQIKGALSSDAWLDIMADKDDRDQFRNKVDNFILRARNKHVSAYDSDIIDALEKASRVWASFGAARALAGVTQPFKQTVPLMFSTIINAGRLNLLTPFASKDANAWIDASGMSIANRGIEAQSGIEDANRLLEDALQSGKMKRVLLAIENANKIGLKAVLSNPDVWIARSAFISYYKQYMKNNGLDTEIDYTDPSKANQDALDYAQHMVDRQQNVSDSDMAGEFLAAGDAPRKLIRNIFFPFATFVMNQKSRMFSDFAALTSKDASTQDKLLAARSLGGLSLEIAAYQSLGWTIRAYGIKYLADLLIGDDEEDEKEKEDAEKAFRNQTQYMVTQVIKDVLSPSPAFDSFIVSGGDKVMNIVQKEFDVYEDDAKKALTLVNEQRKKDKKRQLEGIEAERWIEKYIAENRFKLSDFENDSKYGMYSITSSKMAELHDSYLLAYEGKYTVEDNRGNKTTKYVLEKDREILKKMFPYMVVYNAVGFPAEISSLNRKVETAVKKKGITEGMSDTYNEYLKKTGKKKINALEEELLRTTKATDKYSAVERVIQKAEIFEKAGKFNDEKTIEKTLKKYKSDEKFREFISELASKK